MSSNSTSLSKHDFSPLSQTLTLKVVSIQTNHMCHITSTQMRDYFLPIWFFPSLSPCWFFIHGGEWCKPPRKLSYKHTFGMPDQGQMLDVWGQHPYNVNPTVKIHRFTTSSSRFTDSIFHPTARNWIREKYCRIGISAIILSHTDKK